jgi:hypothetical protein
MEKKWLVRSHISDIYWPKLRINRFRRFMIHIYMHACHKNSMCTCVLITLIQMENKIDYDRRFLYSSISISSRPFSIVAIGGSTVSSWSSDKIFSFNNNNNNNKTYHRYIKIDLGYYIYSTWECIYIYSNQLIYMI